MRALFQSALSMSRQINIGRRRRAKTYQCAKSKFPVLERYNDALPSDSAFDIRFALICCQSAHDKATLTVLEPLGIFGRIGDEEVKGYG